MNRLLICLATLCVFSAFAMPQTATDKTKRSEEIQLKMHQLDLLAQIMPIGMTKEQITAILPKIEKMRAEQRKIMASEDDELIKLEAKVDEAMKLALEKGDYPSRAILGSIKALHAALALRRTATISEMSTELYDDLKKNLNAGQLTIMAKTINAKLLNPEKPDEVKDEERIKTFIKVFLLDPASYDLLLKLSK